jgi:uncharacterized protein (TIGR03435 family)
MHTERSKWKYRLPLLAASSGTERKPGAQKRLFMMAMVLAMGAIDHGVAVFGQVQETNATAGPAFEVVSVKPDGLSYTPAPPGEKVLGRHRPFRYSDRRLSALTTLRNIIQEAYSVEDWAVEAPVRSGTASWIDLLVYDIQATMPPNTNKETARLMLRTMLAERFGLKFHFEKRDIPVYALVEGKNGFKLREATGNPALSAEMAEGKFTGTGTLDNIASYSRSYADRPVVNMTGIEGVYHIELQWMPDVERSVSPYDPVFWAALERAAGLKRESRKLPRDVIVVDHAEREPTPN